MTGQFDMISNKSQGRESQGLITRVKGVKTDRFHERRLDRRRRGKSVPG